ncbi:alpha/beta hydrolase [Paenibacillus albiflavus]|uniref:Alpha/beta hydrolase n=1 Tax=Paenibacillus albiflavus TaxID=2545760 RepID=A0A4R4EHH9_9BACL|nr:alpha/beta hydrolase [Paenibacillus albiflavus]TCZ79299.1 alpha/beta hydrolase [Paenibacillus albiflavus]
MKETRIFKQTDQCDIQADVYYQGAGSPVIIYIHGGALIFGTRTWLSAEQIAYFTSAGFSLVNIDYRLAPETNFEEIIEDIRDVIEWVRTKAIEWYDFDIHNMAVMGGSAGGYLSLLTGTMEIKPKAIVSFYGYGDLLGDWYTEPSEFYCKKPMIKRSEALEAIDHKEVTNGDWKRFIYYLYCRQQGIWVQEVTGLDPKDDYEKLLKYCPIHNITENYPPTLLLHGDQDTDVPYEQSVLMYEKLQEIGVSSELITIKGADHVFDQKFKDDAVQEAFKKVVDFLRTHLSS